jgi:hypothetical protein
MTTEQTAPCVCGHDLSEHRVLAASAPLDCLRCRCDRWATAVDDNDSKAVATRRALRDAQEALADAHASLSAACDEIGETDTECYVHSAIAFCNCSVATAYRAAKAALAEKETA